MNAKGESKRAGRRTLLAIALMGGMAIGCAGASAELPLALALEQGSADGLAGDLMTQALSGMSFLPTEGQDYFLQNVGTATPGSSEYGCHGQGIKFDGTAFYTTCMETDGNDTAYLYAHDAAGNRVRQFSYSSSYDHPSGILLRGGWAYTGFTHMSINMYSRLYRFNGAGTVQYQGYFSHSVGSVGLKIASPSSATSAATTRYYSFDQYYERQCNNSDNQCTSYNDYTTANNIDGSEGIQDCDTYFKNGRWYKACILFSNAPNRIRVWDGGTTRLGPDNALSTFSMSSEPGHSGGFGFYLDPQGTKWVVTAPPPATNRRTCGGCLLVGGSKCACTDKQNRQRVRFTRFDRYNWPG